VDALDGDPQADNFTVGQGFYYLLAVQNEGDADLKLDLTFSLTSELALGTEPVGFVDSISSISLRIALSCSDMLALMESISRSIAAYSR
jgi:hypothetical protein